MRQAARFKSGHQNYEIETKFKYYKGKTINKIKKGTYLFKSYITHILVEANHKGVLKNMHPEKILKYHQMDLLVRKYFL